MPLVAAPAGDAAGSRARETAWSCEVAGAIANHVTELVYQSVSSNDQALSWLDRLRVSLRADDALLWIVTETGATAALRARHTFGERRAPNFPVDRRQTAFDRLRRNGLVVCGAGEVSGVEDFVPAGVSSFVAAGANRQDTLASVLVLGWNTPLPSCGASSLAQLRVAAALLERAISAYSQPPRAIIVDDAALDAARDSIAMVNRDGTLATWSAGQRDGAARDTPGRAMNYVERCRRLAKSGSVEAAFAVEGLEAVVSGDSDFFQTAITRQERGHEIVTIMTATPRPAHRGGAVVTCTDLAPGTIEKLTSGITARRFARVVDALPIPFWIAAMDGRVTCASRCWQESVGDSAAASIRPSQWCDPVHPSDRPRAAAAFDAAVVRGEGFQLELRLRGTDGRYRWSSCVAEPLFIADGTVESYVGACIDISARRWAESALDKVAAKLLAAQEGERSRIARELHDDLGQQVVLLDATLATAMRHRWSRAQSASTLSATRLKLQEIASTIHALAHRLHPAKLKLLGLVPTLQSLCREMATEAQQEVDFEARRVPSEMDEEVVLCIFRVAQEALQNAVKHSGARTISVQLIGTGDSLQLRIVDDGSGFDPLVSSSAGMGLLTMRERVELAGGTLAVTTVPSGGTTIEVTLNAKRRSRIA